MPSTWEDITPPGVQLAMLNGQTIYGSQAILVDPQDTSHIYTGVDHQGVFESNDCGATWTKVNTGRNGATLDTGAQWSMAMDPYDPSIIYAVNGYGMGNSLWKTTNGGTDWDNLFPDGSEVAQTVQYDFASVLSMDPTDHLHLVVSFHANCMGAYAPSCQAESKDGGMTWRLMVGPNPAGGWEGAGPIVLNDTSWLYALPSNGLFLTTDNGATWKSVAPAGIQGGHYQIYHSKLGTYYLGTLQGMITSPDGMAWTAIANSPGDLNGLVGTGKNLFVSQQIGGQFFTATEADPTKWTTLPTPGRPSSQWGAYLMAYDADHKLLYATTQQGGLWRVLTD
jgi:photosystem II stability/assembly factor-like uncharacterized protein